MKKPTLYCISGLGVDHRVFDTLHLPEMELIHVPWIAPLKNESLPAYAARLFQTVSIQPEDAIIGVSFGGMIAQEFFRLQSVEKLFLVSTIHNSYNLPLWMRLGGKLGLHKLIPNKLIAQSNFISRWLFTIKPPQRALFKQIMDDTDAKFLKWAMTSIVHWKPEDQIPEAVRIHGIEDRILSAPNNIDHLLPDGHFMIVSQGTVVSEIIRSAIAATQ